MDMDMNMKIWKKKKKKEKWKEKEKKRKNEYDYIYDHMHGCKAEAGGVLLGREEGAEMESNKKFTWLQFQSYRHAKVPSSYLSLSLSLFFTNICSN